MLSSNIANFIIMVAFKLEAQYAEPVSLTIHSALRKPDTEPSIDDSYQVSVHLAMQFQRKRFFRNRPIRNKNCMWPPCLLTNWTEMSNLYRGSDIDASYQVSVHVVKRFQRRILRNQPIRNKNCLWRPCLLMDQDEMSNLYREPSIDASNQVSIHLAKQFQGRRFLKIGQSEIRIACGSHVC